MMTRARAFFGDLWTLIHPYWRSEERVKSGILLVSIVGLSLGSVYLQVLFNSWNNDFYNALQDKDLNSFWHNIIYFMVLAVIYIVIAVYQIYLRQMLQIRWRRWLTKRYIGEWLGHRAYYRLQLGATRTDNPDQRIAEDIENFVSQTLTLSLGLFESVVTLASFATILWALSGSITIAGIAIPGYMLWVALVYSGVGSWLMHLVGRPLIGLNFRQQRLEADFRFSLVRLRENAESVALYRGEDAEEKNFDTRFSHVVDNFWSIMRQNKRLTWFASGYAQLAIIFPLVVAAPRYFSGAIPLGGLMQTSSAFGQVQGALSWFVDAYSSLASWKATIDRLIGFERNLIANAATKSRALTVIEASHDTGINVADLRLFLPDGAVLLKNLDLEFSPGSRTLIAGPSGSGKSTLFRAISGLWPYCQGILSMPAGERLLFLPQVPYLPIGTLRRAVAYPGNAEDFDDATLNAMLAECGLSHLAGKLDDERHWAQLLSPGEQQRVAIARALLLKPHWLFLDEATSALDEESEEELYRLLITALQETAIVSIAHRKALARFHSRKLLFAPDKSANWVDLSAA